MKRLLLPSLVLLVISCGNSGKKNSIASKPDTSETTIVVQEIINLNFIGDSGYIEKEVGLKFMLANSLTDTLNSMWNELRATDTIGKYFRLDSGYIACFHDWGGEDPWRTHILCELNQNESSTELVDYDRYYHGNHPGCWNTWDEGFRRINDYFLFAGCIYGSCFEGTKVKIFRNLDEFKTSNPIPIEIFDCGNETNYTKVISKIKIQNSAVYIYYMEEKGIIMYDDSSKKLNPKTRLNFSVKYIKNGVSWEMEDSTYAGKLEM